MNSSSEDIKDMLESKPVLGLAFRTNLFIGREPSDPDDCVTIFDGPGYPPHLTLGGGTPKYDRPSAQIQIRNSAYDVGWALANDIKVFLHGKRNETWNGTRYVLVEIMNDPFFLNWDNNNRARFIVNVEIQRKDA